jgi:hypothetical protein
MYSMMAAAEDLWMAERWQKDADGILIFVSFYIGFHTTTGIHARSIDWLILRGRCCTARSDYPGPKGKPSRYFQFLSPATQKFFLVL